jgi:sortase (surface protein transpeptidase)
VTAVASRRLELGLAVLVPAALAALVTLLLVPGSPATAPFQVHHGKADRLARLAELRPIVLRGDRTELGTGPAGPLTTTPRPAVPTSMAIPALHVDAPVGAVTTTATGDLEVPPIGRAGWYDAGARPGEPGRAVIVGHIDGATQPGVFEHVPEIADGSEIVVRDADGGVHNYAVVGKLQVPKSNFPASEVYGPSKRPVLVLVTCGGVYVPNVGYSDNVIVYARAVS